MIGTLSLELTRTVTMQGPLRATAAATEAESSVTLVLRAKQGDGSALERLCERYLPRLRRWAHGRLPRSSRSSLDTHDLAQDTLTGVVRRLPAFEPRHEGAFQAYVRQALTNRVRDEARRAKHRHVHEALESGYPCSGSSPLEEAIGTQARMRYHEAMTRLRTEERQAIVARIEKGLPYTEVAAILGKPSVAAAHMAVSRALVRLAKEMSHGPRA
jgi:RNA polymerase sigma factor (sigma-70 family)